jgi:RNA polymerase sigma-70 factor (ECF subfamily)
MAGKESAFKVSRDPAEERLLIEAAQRDPARFAELYENYFELVYAYVARRVQQRDAAEDLTAEVFRKALEHLPRFNWRGVPFGAWLLRIGANLLADRGKRAGREESVVDFDDVTEVADYSLKEVEHTANLFRTVKRLPQDQRRVIMMRFGDERSIREIAGELGRSEGAVKQLQFRALENLRKLMGKKSE